MEIFKRARLEHKKSLGELSLATGISKTTLWEFEQGNWLPDPDQAATLGKVLGITGIPDSSQVISRKQMQQLCRPHPVDWPRTNPIPWHRMEQVFASQLRQMDLDPELLAWMKECLASDSPFECIFLCVIAADGAKSIVASPHGCGYRAQPILGRDGLALGERQLPGLLWHVDGVPCLVWPQITVLTPKGSFRLDLLMLIQNRWVPVELNGKSHSPDYDKFRAAVLNQRPIYITNEAIRQLTFLEPLKQELRKLIGKRREYAPVDAEQAS